MEKLVRPFQTRDISPPKPIKTAQNSDSSDSEPENVQFGKGGSPKILFGNETIDVTYYAIKKMREKPKDN